MLDNKTTAMMAVCALLVLLVVIFLPIKIKRDVKQELKQEIMQEIQRNYVPGPYTPGYDPDKIDLLR